MEDFDPRRRQDQERQRARQEDHGRDRDSWWRGERSHDDDHPRRAERGWLDYDRDYGRSDESQGRREDQRYGQERSSERSRFSPDWSREGSKPRYSDDPYYSRNREPDGLGRVLAARPLRRRARQGNDWPYERSGQGRDLQRSREDEQGSHYRGSYSRSATPFSYPGGSGYLYSESVTLHGPYTGRGPKGYKRSDQQIVEEACQRLERDGEIDASEIEVSAEDGVIRLRGTVQDRNIEAPRRGMRRVDLRRARRHERAARVAAGRRAIAGRRKRIAGVAGAAHRRRWRRKARRASSGRRPDRTPGTAAGRRLVGLRAAGRRQAHTEALGATRPPARHPLRRRGAYWLRGGFLLADARAGEDVRHAVVAFRAGVLVEQAVERRQRIDAAPRLGPRVGVDDRERVLERVLVDARDALRDAHLLGRVAPRRLRMEARRLDDERLAVPAADGRAVPLRQQACRAACGHPSG